MLSPEARRAARTKRGTVEATIAVVRSAMSTLNKDVDERRPMPKIPDGRAGVDVFVKGLRSGNLPHLAKAVETAYRDENGKFGFPRLRLHRRKERLMGTTVVNDLLSAVVINATMLDRQANIRRGDTSVGQRVLTFYDLLLSPLPIDLSQQRVDRLSYVNGFVLSPLMKQTLRAINDSEHPLR